MADLSFLFDKDKGFADTKVVGGDFLLTDTNVIKPEIINTDRITVSGGGSLVADGAYNFNGSTWFKNAAFYIKYVPASPPFIPTGYWTIFNDFGGGFDMYTSTDGDATRPPETGWKTVDGVPPVPLVRYDRIESSSRYLTSSLQVAVEISLFTDRRATDDEMARFQTGIQERQSRRGYWANLYKENAQGSGLWLLDREKKTQETLARAKTFCLNALDWLIEDGVIQSLSVDTSFEGSALIISIEMTKPNGQEAGFKYQFTWDSLEVIQ